MKILYLNVYEGCQQAGRFKKIIGFVNNQHPDILGLSELNGWQEKNFGKLGRFKRATGFPFHVFVKAPSGYNIGLFSKIKPTHVYTDSTHFNTGMIKADYLFDNKHLSVILTHLHHINEDARLKEIKLIFSKIKPDQPTLLMGDLNSLSPLDTYPEKKLLAQMKKINLDKFGKDKLRREVIKKILDFGLVDAVKIFSKKFEYSVPSSFNRDPKHFNKLRLDYIFVTKSLKPRLRAAKIIRTPVTNQLSDHFPILAELA